MKKDFFTSGTFKRIMYLKFFMVIVVWGLFPLLVPKEIIPFFGLILDNFQLILLRIWGIVVLLDSLIYFYIYFRPKTKLSKYLMLFAVLDNGGLGVLLILLTSILNLPWGIWINIPFQLFFGYWFWKFYQLNSQEELLRD